MVGGILDGWRNTGWLRIMGWLEQNWMVEEYRIVGGIQDGWRNTGWLEEYRLVDEIQDGWRNIG